MSYGPALTHSFNPLLPNEHMENFTAQVSFQATQHKLFSLRMILNLPVGYSSLHESYELNETNDPSVKKLILAVKKKQNSTSSPRPLTIDVPVETGTKGRIEVLVHIYDTSNSEIEFSHTTLTFFYELPTIQSLEGKAAIANFARSLPFDERESIELQMKKLLKQQRTRKKSSSNKQKLKPRSVVTGTSKPERREKIEEPAEDAD